MFVNFNQQNTLKDVRPYMKAWILILGLLVNHLIGMSQNNTVSASKYNCNWTNLCLNKEYTAKEHDSCLFVVSTRNYDVTKKEFVDYDYDTTATLKYFMVYFSGNNWTAVPYSSLKEMLDTKAIPGNFVIFTEGLGKTFTAGIDRTTRLMRIYPVNGLLFDWPTDRPYMRSGQNIKATYKVASEVAVPYARFLEEFQEYKTDHSAKFSTVTLFFHSMGNLILMNDLKRDLFKNIRPGLADNVILNAACVNQYQHKEWLDKLNFSQHIYITINNRDKNLRGARLIFRAHQLGEKPKGALSKKATYINFSDVLDKEHNYFIISSLIAKKPFLKEFYLDVFTGQTPQLEFHKEALTNSTIESKKTGL